MGAPFHGKQGLIYVSGVEIVGANAWTIDMARDTVEVPQLGDTWKKAAGGLLGWSGTITAWEQGDEMTIIDASTSVASVALLIYPTKDDTADFYSGNAFFGASSDGSTGSGVSKNGTFVGDGTLTITGFA